MSYYVNLGYYFKLPSVTGTPPDPEGSVILASTMPAHQLERRNMEKYPHLQRRLFDPQLYLAGLDVTKSKKHCAYLATYPWFGVEGLDEYESNQQSQRDWRSSALESIHEVWPSEPPSDPDLIRDSVGDCIEFQDRLGCEGWILPSPLTTDLGGQYEQELIWLDAALAYIQETYNTHRPVFATIALADLVVRYTEPDNNILLDIITDSVSAREIDGVYIVLEQGAEPAETRHCGDIRSLESILNLVHTFSQDCGLVVVVNFLGQFGLACEAAGADIWASAWYKSLYRLRIADMLAGGRAYPRYWSYSAACDIHLNEDFDRLANAGMIPELADETEASRGLLAAARSSRKAEHVPEWRYAQSNVTASREHYLRSSINAEMRHNAYLDASRLDKVEEWLRQAAEYISEIENVLGSNSQTNTRHVQAWLGALQRYRQDHDV